MRQMCRQMFCKCDSQKSLNMNKKKNTILLFGMIILFSVIALICQKTIFQKPGSYAVVQIDGKERARLNLSEDTTLQVGGEQTGSNTIEVRDGCVFVSEADCPDQVCVRTGRVQDVGSVIACLPHKLTVTVVGEVQEEQVDGIAR